MNLVGQILTQASAGSITALTKIEGEINDYVNSLPASVSECLAGNQEIASAVAAYGLTNADQTAIEKKVTTYLLFHLSAVTASVKSINSAFTAGNFDNAGQQAGALVKKILGVSSTTEFLTSGDAVTDVSELIDGKLIYHS